jgi:hypothetical protein
MGKIIKSLIMPKVSYPKNEPIDKHWLKGKIKTIEPKEKK